MEQKYYSMENGEEFQNKFARLYPEFRDALDLSDGKTHLVTKNITFVTTEDCNLACTYCYEKSKTKGHMSIDVARQTIDMLFDEEKMNGYITNEHKCAIIEFIGGEPLMNMDVIEFVCEYFRYKAFEMNHPWYKFHMFSITTNGVLFRTPRVQKWLKKYKDVISVSITIDGDKELHDSCRLFHNGKGSYDVVAASVKNAVEEFGLNSTKVTLAPENIDKINTAIPHLFELGLTNINANVVFENVWKDEHAPMFYNELKKLADYMIETQLYKRGYVSLFDKSVGQFVPHDQNNNWCGGNGEMLAVGIDGRFFPCIRYMKYALNGEQEQPIGDLKKGLQTATDNIFLGELQNLTRKSQSTDECWNCKVGSGCAWCTAYNYSEFGTPNKRATYICKMHKARVLANYYYWTKLFKIENITDEKPFVCNLSDDEVKFISGGKSLDELFM